jgi:sacsin
MQEMGGLAWCPVLAEAPVEGLPWPTRQELVAPPRAIRPLQDLWLCSGNMRILAADCRSCSPLSALNLPDQSPA